MLKCFVDFIFAILYAYLEVYYIRSTQHATPQNLFSFYRIVYFALFLDVTYSSSIRLWVSCFLLTMVVEDISYWIIARKVPYQWTWYYFVWHGVPVIDVIEFIVALIIRG